MFIQQEEKDVFVFKVRMEDFDQRWFMKLIKRWRDIWGLNVNYRIRVELLDLIRFSFNIIGVLEGRFFKFCEWQFCVVGMG